MQGECREAFVLRVGMGNQAMCSPADLAVAVAGVAGRVGEGATEGVVVDGNGNAVGGWSVVYPDDVYDRDDVAAGDGE